MDNNKIVLAFSGGLDTSFCALYLKEKGYNVITALVNTGGFSQDELDKISRRSTELGAVKHYSINAEQNIYDQVIQYLIKLNGLYEGDYPVMCADRYVIAQEILKIAEMENTVNVAHGSTAVGNDQVRFDSAFMTLNPDAVVVKPIKELNITREEEISYLEEKGFSVDKSVKKYSINENVFGTTFSGSEIDDDLEPGEEACLLTRPAPDFDYSSSLKIKISFEQGLPVRLNGKQRNGLDILKELNQIAGSFAVGKKIYTGDCVIGIKGRILFEAPGLFTLLEAHRKLEQIVLTKEQLKFNEIASSRWSDLVYSGLYYEPLTKNLEVLADSVQKNVTGEVTIKLSYQNAEAVEVSSPFSLINKNIATYAQKSKWNGEEADAFIRFHSLTQKIAYSFQKRTQ